MLKLQYWILSKARSSDRNSNWIGLQSNENKAMCSFPCQRVSHFVKLTDIMHKLGLAHELRNVFKFIFICLVSEVQTLNSSINPTNNKAKTKFSPY